MPGSVPRSQFDNFLAPMAGHPAWGVRNGYGSFVTLEFGAPAPARGRPRSDDDPASPAHGEMHLWLYCCHWKIMRGDTQLAFSESDKLRIDYALSMLEGEALEAVSVDPEIGGSCFRFADDLRIETWPYGENEFDEQWFVYAGNRALSYRADGMFSITHGDTPPTKERWQPLA